MSDEANTPAGGEQSTTVDTPPSTTALDTTSTETPANTPAGGANKTLLGGDAPDAPKETPIEYKDFELPEGFELGKEDAKLLTELGQEFKMPQEAVQKLVNLGVAMQQREIVQQQKTIAAWEDAARQDSEYGGDKLEQSLLTAQKAFTLPRGDKISKILANSGLGNHPDVIWFMTEVGKLMQSDKMVTGPNANNQNVSPASVWYDKS